MRDSLDCMIEVMQAANEGKAIEIYSTIDSKWHELRSPTWNWHEFSYRIKPEPKEDWILETSCGFGWKYHAYVADITESELRATGWGLESTGSRYRRVEPAKENK